MEAISDIYFVGFTQWLFGANGSSDMSAAAGREWVLRRNCSITPRQLGGFYASLCVVSLLLASFFTLQGAWYVMIFSVIELSAVGAAFLHFARHASDREHILFANGRVVVDLIESEKSRQFEFEARALQVDAPGARNNLVSLRTTQAQLDVGRFVTQFKRRQFALELRQALQSSR